MALPGELAESTIGISKMIELAIRPVLSKLLSASFSGYLSPISVVSHVSNELLSLQFPH